MPIVWGMPAPARMPKSWIRLLCVRAGQSVQVRLLGPALGIYTHHVKGRTIACLGEGECRYHNFSQEWKGYCPAALLQARTATAAAYWKETVLVVTPGIAEDVLACQAGDLLEVSRPGSKANGPLRIRPAAKQPVDEAPPPFDVRPYVIRAMGLPGNFACKLQLHTA